EIVPDTIVIDLDDLAHFLRAILAHGGFPLRPLIRLATTSLAGPRGHRPSLKFAKDSVRHRAYLPSSARALICPVSGCAGGHCQYCGGEQPVTAPGRIEIVLANGLRVIVDQHVDIGALMRVISVVERR